MKSITATFLLILLITTAVYPFQGESAGNQYISPSENTLAGQVLLPSGFGSRGVELKVTLSAPGSEPRIVWVLFDEQGYFTHSYQGKLIGVQITAGIGAEVHRMGTEELPEVNEVGNIDLGVIDLRDFLIRHRLVVRSVEEKSSDNIRVAMWFGPPPVGPYGGAVSLGSRQFPTIPLGIEVEWLLPNEGQSIYFLVEQPSGSGGGTKWVSGQQQLFGPFTSAEAPALLTID